MTNLDHQRVTDQTGPPPMALAQLLDAPDVADAVPLLDRAVADTERLSSYRQIPEDDGLHLSVTISHRLILGIAALEHAGWVRADILERLQAVRRVHAGSPFIRRLQEWPRGYPGDYETVECLVRQENRAPRGTLAFWLEQYALQSAIAQQHRNKVQIQAGAILDTVLDRRDEPRAPRILILAAGGSPDLRAVASLIQGEAFRVVLLDQDPSALVFSADRLEVLGDRVAYFQRNVIRGLYDVVGDHPYDLVLAGGLFDYLPDKVAGMVLRHVRQRLLAPTGRLLFTNISHPNAYRRWIEYLADWHLIHRSEDDVRELCGEAGFREPAVSVTREGTGLTLIVECAGPERWLAHEPRRR